VGSKAAAGAAAWSAGRGGAGRQDVYCRGGGQGSGADPLFRGKWKREHELVNRRGWPAERGSERLLQQPDWSCTEQVMLVVTLPGRFFRQGQGPREKISLGLLGEIPSQELARGDLFAAVGTLSSAVSREDENNTLRAYTRASSPSRPLWRVSDLWRVVVAGDPTPPHRPGNRGGNRGEASGTRPRARRVSFEGAPREQSRMRDERHAIVTYDYSHTIYRYHARLPDSAGGGSAVGDGLKKINRGQAGDVPNYPSVNNVKAMDSRGMWADRSKHRDPGFDRVSMRVEAPSNGVFDDRKKEPHRTFHPARRISHLRLSKPGF